MKILVYGSDKFTDYQTFMRGIVVAIDEKMPAPGPIEIMSAGPYKINSFSAEFINRSETFLRQKGYKPRYRKVRYNDMAKNFDNMEIDSVLYFGVKNEAFNSLDPIISAAEKRNITVNYYKI
jgi:hypothetical protein